jgi:hypothetical protein
LRCVLELVEEQMGRPVESQLVEAGEVVRSVQAPGAVVSVEPVEPIEGDERPGDVVEIEPAEPLLLLGKDRGAKGAEALEERASEPLGVDKVLGDKAAHRRIELLQGGVGGALAVGLGHLDRLDVLFEEEGPLEVHRREGFEEGGHHLGGQGALGPLGDGLHLLPQPVVPGGEACLFGLERSEQVLGALPGRKRLFPLVQGLDQGLGRHLEDPGRDHDALQVGKDLGVLEETRVGKGGDDLLFVLVGDLRHGGLRGEEAVEEGIDGRKMHPAGAHDEPELLGCALVALLDGIENPLFHLRRRGAGKGGGDDELPLPVQVAADLLGQAVGLPGARRGGDEEALYHGLPPVR